MKNWQGLKNSFELLGFYYNDALRGLFNKPFFKNKWNRYSFGGLGLALYFLYFLANMKEVGKMAAGVEGVESSILLELTRITIASYMNMSLVFGILIYVLLNSVLSLTKSSIYITSILPYSEKEVLISQKLFRLSVGLVGYEAIFILVFPLFNQLANVTIPHQLLLLLLFHLVFVTVFGLMDVVYSTLLQLVKNSLVRLTFFLDVGFTTLSSVYLLTVKFKVDKFLGELSLSLQDFILLFLLVSLVLFGLVVTLIYRFNLNIPYYKKQSYGMLRLPMLKLNLATTFPSIYRHKNFIYTTLLVLLFTVVAIYQTGVSNGLSTLATLTPLLTLSGINYSDATAKIRKQYNFFRISLFREVTSLIFAGLLLTLIPLGLTLFLEQSPLQFFLSFSVYLVAVTLGILFPSTQGNLNETASTTTTIFLTVLLYFIFNVNNIVLSTMILLILISLMTIFLTKERKN